MWGIGATYDVHLRLIGNRIVDFLLLLIELLRSVLVTTREVIRVNFDGKSAYLLERISLAQNF